MATTHADVNAILADDKDIVAKQDGGILVIGEFGEKVLQAKDATELPAGVGDGTMSAATTSAAGLVKQAEAQADSTATTVAGLVSDFNALLAKLRTAGTIAS